MDEREARIGTCKGGIDDNDLLIQRLELRQHFGREGSAAKPKGSQEYIVRSQILRWAPPRCISRSSMTRCATMVTMLCAISA